MGQYNSFKFGFILDNRSRNILEDFHDSLIQREPKSAEGLIRDIELLQSLSDNSSTTFTVEQVTDILYFLKRSVLKQEPLSDEQKPFVIRRNFSPKRKYYLAKSGYETRNCFSIHDARRFATKEDAEVLCFDKDTVVNFFEEIESKTALIWAMDKNWLIGNGNKLPWHYVEDLRYFKNITKDQNVLMGAATYNSMKCYYKDKALPFRSVYVADLDNNKYEDATTITDVHSFIKNFDKKIFVIGGSVIYKLMLPYADELYITHIDAEHDGNVYMERFDLAGDFKLVSSVESGIFKFNKYIKNDKGDKNVRDSKIRN